MDPLGKIAARCRVDLFYLDKYILNYDRMETEVHGELCKYVEALNGTSDMPATGETKGMDDQFTPSNKSLLMLMPRNSYKSSVVTIGYTLQLLLNEPNARVLIDSETFGQAKAFLSEIKGHLEENEKYRAVFHRIHGVYPDSVEGGSRNKNLLWSDSKLVVQSRNVPKKEPSISCGGIDVAKNGMHYDLIICDDLHSKNNVTNMEQITQVIDHWKLAYSLLEPGKAMIIIGTRWDYNDLYQHILDNQRHRFNIITRKAINDDGSYFFPQILTPEFLEEQKKTQGSYIFSCQYQNNPVDNETATFKRSSIIRKSWEEIKDLPINWYIAVDPSYEGEYSDYAALVVAGMDHMNKLYVRHVLRAKMTYGEIINNMFDLSARFDPKIILLETLGAQKSIMFELRNQEKQRGRWLKVQEVKYRSASKEERVRGLAPFYEFGRIFHVKESPQLDELEDELIHFPKGKHDDIVDALSSILEVATPSNQNRAPDSVMKKRRVLYKPRSLITGV